MAFSIQTAARQHPRRIALVSSQGTWSFAAVAQAAARLARRIPQWQQKIDTEASRAESSRPPVALLGETRISTLIALYALFELEIPVVLIHPRWTRRERLQAVHQSGAGLYLKTSTGFSSTGPSGASSDLDAIEDPTSAFDALAADGRPLSPLGPETHPDEEALEVLPDVPPRASLPGESMALVFTSGTTSTPKAALLSRQAFLASARASEANLGWQRDDRWLLSLPVAHVGGLSVVTRCLAGRRTVVLDPSAHFNPKSFGENLSKYRVTLASLVPTMLHRLLQEETHWRPPSTLRALLVGGAAASPVLLKQAAARQVPVLTTYGLTETCSQVTTQSYPSSLPPKVDPHRVREPLEGCGRPLPGFQVRIHDGQIQVKGDGLMTGYLPLRHRPQPFTADGWLETGDLGYLSSTGELVVLGRKGDLIITGGENVHPQAVEEVLRQHPGLEDVCVFGVADPVWGQRVAAALVPGVTGAPDDSDLAAFCRERMARFKIPRAVAYLPQIPLQPNGKVNRRQVARDLKDKLRELRLS
ncbi:MAG: AMP-binding protein [Deltaproteobacteria bacterium]|nr:AMP-binding protein [Deltaproteobacteria bacterium]